MPQELDVARFQVDHVRPQQHHGPTVFENLAVACFPCNNHKGPNLAGIDPDTAEMQPLFNPREDVWDEHFEWRGAQLVGKSPIGRATVDVLAINLSDRVALRRELISEGVFPPA